MLDADVSYFYIDSGTKFYWTMLKYCNLIGITVEEFFEKWELQRLNYQEAIKYLMEEANFSEEEAKEYLNRSTADFEDEHDFEDSTPDTDLNDAQTTTPKESDENSADLNGFQIAQEVFNEFSALLVPELLLLLAEVLGESEEETSEQNENTDSEEETNEDEEKSEQEKSNDEIEESAVEQEEEIFEDPSVAPEDVDVENLNDDALLEFLKNLSNQVKDVATTAEKKSRSQVLVKKMKELYGHKCQLCNPVDPIPSIEMLNGLEYVEMHHIIPISDSSAEDESDLILDDYSNCVVVCPYHHKVLHYHKGGFKEIDEMIDGLYFVNDEAEVKIYLNKHIQFK